MSADRNLLFGVLALQMDFISRDALVQAMNAWVFDKAKPLGQILLDQGQLEQAHRQLLDAVVQEHLRLHDNDAEKSLATLSSLGSVHRDLGKITDPDVQASLAAVSSIGFHGAERVRGRFSACHSSRGDSRQGEPWERVERRYMCEFGPAPFGVRPHQTNPQRMFAHKTSLLAIVDAAKCAAADLSPELNEQPRRTLSSPAGAA